MLRPKTHVCKCKHGSVAYTESVKNPVNIVLIKQVSNDSIYGLKEKVEHASFTKWLDRFFNFLNRKPKPFLSNLFIRFNFYNVS